MLEALCEPIGGGTQFTVAFNKVTENWSSRNSSSDVIVITDGEDVYQPIPTKALELKAQGVKFSVLYVSMMSRLDTLKPKLAQLFDTILVVDRLAKGDKHEKLDFENKLYTLTEQQLNL